MFGLSLAAHSLQTTALLRLAMTIERLQAEADEADEEGDSVAAAEMRGRAAELQVGGDTLWYWCTSVLLAHLEIVLGICFLTRQPQF
jgi:hypothetical protein